ncbi:hypothetical protein FBU30_009372, partial [Linnemannia zychae]
MIQPKSGMSTTFPLPLECLHLILHYLIDQAALKSLASLLCVNKYVCAATLPVLYGDPYKALFYKSFWERQSNIRIAIGYRKLTRLFLRSLSANKYLITDIVYTAYFVNNLGQDEGQGEEENKGGLDSEPELLLSSARKHQQLPSTALPYISFISTIAFEENIQRLSTVFTIGNPLAEPNFQDFLQKTGRVDRYKQEDPIQYKLWKRVENQRFFIEAAAREIRQELTWVFCSANAEQIRTLHISIADIGRYKALIPRLKLLSDIGFQIDRNLKSLPGSSFEWTEDESAMLVKLKEDRTRHLEDMLQFVNEYQIHHPNTLRTVRCLNQLSSDDACPEKYQLQLSQLLGPLIKPFYLDHRNWYQFVVHVSDTDLSYVKTIDFSSREILRGSIYMQLKMGLILQRCRSLGVISVTNPEEDIFKWAVLERKSILDRAGKEEIPQGRLVHLREYIVNLSQMSSWNRTNDALFAFNDSLEKIFIDFKEQTNLGGNISQLTLAQELGGRIGIDDSFSSSYNISSLQFPRLQVLSLYKRTLLENLQFHPTFLARAPNLEYIVLLDYHNSYSLAYNVIWKPADLPKLVELYLVGPMAISFHPDTFKSTRKLKRLELRAKLITPETMGPSGTDQEGGNINEESNPSDLVAILYSGLPLWTWDWELPNLSFLSLAGHFARNFQFRMLEGTPNLCMLFLDNFSFLTQNGNSHTIHIADLIKPGFHHPQLDQFLEQERIAKETRLQGLETGDIDNTSDTFEENRGDIRNTDENNVRNDFEYIHVPTLRNLSMKGFWELDYRTLSILFGNVAPNIQNLDLQGCSGFSVSEW